MAALVQLSMTRFQSEDGHHLTPALIAPLILVSPWDVLDVRRRLGVARFVPTMASQVVLMLTRFDSTDEEVLAALEPRVGREYALVLDRPPHFGRTRIERIDRP